MLAGLIYFLGCLSEIISVNGAMIVARRCRGSLFDAMCDGICEWFIVRRRFDFLAAANVLRVRQDVIYQLVLCAR